MTVSKIHPAAAIGGQRLGGGPQTPTTAFNAPGLSSVLRHARPERFPHRFSRVERGDMNRPLAEVSPTPRRA